MRKLKLFSMLLLLLIGVGQMWGATPDVKTDVMFAKGFASYTTNSYSAGGTDRGPVVANGTNATGVTYSMQSFNGSNGQVKGNGSGAANFNCRNTTAKSGYYISKVTLTVKTGTIDGSTSGRSVVYFGTSAFGNPSSAPTGTATTASPNSSGQSTLTWTNTNEDICYFLLYNLKTANAAYSDNSTNSLKVEWTEKSGTPEPEVLPSPTSLTFDAVEAGASAPDAKTFTITGSNLTGNLSLSESTNADYYTWEVTSGSLNKNGSNAVSATVTVTPKNTITASAGVKEGTITISGGGLKSNVNVALSTTVTVPAHSYTYNKAFSSTTISDWSDWGNGYTTPHTVNFDIYNGHAGNDCHVYFAGAAKQGSTISTMPVAKNAEVNLVLDDPDKYISAVKFDCQQWSNKTQTVTLKYSTDGGTSYSTLTPSVSSSFTGSTTGATMEVECLSLPPKTNAVQVSGSNASNQIGYSAVHFDLVDKVTYNINKSETGCTLSVTNGTSAISSAEAGDEVSVSIASTTEGYENASFVVKDADNADVTVTNGKFTMPAKNVTITATATKKTYTVTLSAANGNIQVGGVDKESITVATGETAELTAVPDENYAFSSWATSDGSKVSLSSTTTNPATITVTGAATVTATFVSSAKLNPGFVWSAASAEAVKGQAASLPTITTNPYSLTPTYVSTNTAVAEINSAGFVTIKAVGSTTIKATYAEDATYSAYEASYTLTVKGRVTWHAKRAGTDATTYADYAKDAVPTKPTGDFIASCHSSISLVGWTTEDYKNYSDAVDAPTELYKGNVPAVTDNVDYYAVWGVVEEGGWNEITSLEDLTAGTYAICNSTYFMKAAMQLNQQSQSTGRIDNGDDTPSITNGALDDAPSTDCQWILSINASDKYLIQNGDNYLAGTTAKNKATLTDDATDDHAQWTIDRSNDKFVVENVGRVSDSDTPANRYLRNNDSNGWACYSSTQSTDGAPRFFKYSAGNVTDYTTNCVEPFTVATPTFDPDGSVAYYTSAQNVEISCETENSTIYYTTDGTTTPNKTTGTPYTAAINVSETTTIKAIAYVGDVASEVAEATFTINLPITTIQDLFEEATAIGSTATQKRIITFGNWIVSAIGSDNKTVYVTDNTKGFVIYGADHGFEVGNILSGTVECDLQLYSGFAEIKGLKANNANLTVTTGGTLVPAAAAIKNLGAVNTGAPVILSSVTYDSDGDLVDDEYYYLTPDKMLYDYGSTFELNKIYNVTGVYIYESKEKIAPRNAADIVKLSKDQQTITWYVDNTKEDAIGASYSLDSKDDDFAPVCESNSTGAKSYQSSDPTVATINANTGVIEVVGNGVTTITCNVAGDDDYVDGSKSFTLKVGIGEASWVAATWASENSITSNTDMPTAAIACGDINILWDKGTHNNNKPKYYTDKSAVRFYGGSTVGYNTVAFTATNSKILTGVVFHFEDGHSGANMGASEGEYTGSTATWEGFASSVTFTTSAQTRITSIDFDYVQGTITTLEIEDIELSMLSPAAQDIVYDCNKSNPTIVYSGYDDEVISISNGQITPLKVGTTDVTASIAAEAPYSSAVITFKVTVKSGTEVEDNVVILAQKDGVWYALTNAQKGTTSNTLAGLVVDYFEPASKIISELTPEQKTSITWKRITDGNSVTFQDANDKYLTGASGSTNLSVAAAKCVWTKSGNDYLQGERTFLYSTTNGYFRCYTSSTAGVTDKPIFVESEDICATAYTRTISANIGTICLPYGVAEGHYAGATFYRVMYKKGDPDAPNYVQLEEVGALEAGRPYIFVPDENATEIKLVYHGDAVANPVNDTENDKENHGLYGTFDGFNVDEVYNVNSDLIYILNNNMIRRCGTGCTIGENRAYIIMSEVPEEQNAPVSAPGRRQISLLNSDARPVPTGMDNVQGDEVQCTKIFHNGQIYIFRGDKMYDVTGKAVK